MAKNRVMQDGLSVLKSQLKTDMLQGGYLFCGEETYLCDFYLAAVRKKLIPDPETAFFDAIRLNGGFGNDAPLSERLEAVIMTPPVMNEKKLVEVHETNFEALKKSENAKEFQALCKVLQTLSDYPEVVVVFYCTPGEMFTGYKWDQGAWFQALSDAVCIVPFFLQTPQKLLPWCAKHFAHEKIEIDNEALNRLIDRSGRKMQTLEGEIEKLCDWAHARGETQIKAQDIDRVAVRTEQTEAFGLTNALKQRNVAAAIAEYRIARQSKVEPTLLFAQISGVVNDMWKIKNARLSGMTPDAISTALHIHAYIVKTTLMAAERFSDRELESLLKRCAQTDHQLKFASLDNDVLIERLLTQFA